MAKSNDVTMATSKEGVGLLNPNPDKMLSVPVKKSDPVDLYRPLRDLVARKYSESDAEKVESVLETLNKCRSDMVERGDLSLPMQRDCLIHYFKCLCMVEPLFTADSDDSDGGIMFFWYDAFDPDYICVDGVSSHKSIQLEKAAVLFNLGAIYSQIGASCDRTTALGRHLAMDAFNAAAKFFSELWKVFAKDISATLDLTLLFTETLHQLFSAQASELKLQQQLDDDKSNNDASAAFQKHRCAHHLSKSVSKHYRRAYDLIICDSAAFKHVCSFDHTWIPHLHQKQKFFREEARQRKSFILPNSKRPKTSSLVQSCPLDHDAESITEKLVRGICRHSDLWTPKQQLIYLDLLLSEYSPFKIMDGGKLLANPWDMPPPYPTNFAILSSSSSSSSHLMAFPLKKCEPLDLYESLRSYVALKYSESEAERVEGLFKMVDKLRSEMQRDDLSLPIRRDCLIHYLKCLCMIEPLFPMNTSPNPPIFVWYNAFNPQQDSSQHNIHFEKASVLFNLGALSTQVALSCDLTTIQGHRLAKDALNDALHWFSKLSHEAEKASATIELSVNCANMLREIISAQIADLDWNFPHSCSVRSSSSPALLLYQKAYDLSTLEPLAETFVQSSIPQYLKMKTCPVVTDPGDITQQFLSGYGKVKSLLVEGCQPPCLDIKDGNLVANATLEAVRLALKEMNLQESKPPQ
ncbi:uncharacterized protein LOC107473066 [Arachis duranensis]|uniref:Uncharacterized protein LOC107473066 n=1 Tax=Arachis duranensis TaxID=130453 RepID=A0A6P4CAW0_ARADU|nr:uncharacterized protein LOC107473066 [Arachis duranensis]